MRYNYMSPVLWISLIALALLAGCGRLDSQQNPAAVIVEQALTPGPTNTSVTVQYVERLHATAQALVSVIPTTTADARFPPNKAASLQRSDAWNRAVLTAVALNPTPVGYNANDLLPPDTRLTPVPTEPIRPLGDGLLYEDGTNYRFASLITVSNQWSRQIGDRTLLVYAGRPATPNDRSQGAVLVVALDNTTHEIESGPSLYLTSLRAGGVRIVDIIGEQLTLSAENGVLFVFDLVTRQWISPTLTPVTTPAGTPALLPRDRSATRIARFNNEQATVLAQATNFALGTPYPGDNPPPRPTRPATTPVPGINTDCVNANKEFSYVNCWNALIGDQYVFADTGVLKSDPLQAVLHVYTATLDLRDKTAKESYPTSIRVGKISISSVNWPLMTLTTLQASPPTTFVFDLSTRQWVSPPTTPGPSPSVLVSPVPSVSPVPTQSP
jgi:hypothetical protein